MTDMKRFYVAYDGPASMQRVAGNLRNFFTQAGLLDQAASIIDLPRLRELQVTCTQEAMESFRNIGDQDSIVQIEPEVILSLRQSTVDGAGPVNLLK